MGILTYQIQKIHTLRERARGSRRFAWCGASAHQKYERASERVSEREKRKYNGVFYINGSINSWKENKSDWAGERAAPALPLPRVSSRLARSSRLRTPSGKKLPKAFNRNQIHAASPAFFSFIFGDDWRHNKQGKNLKALKGAAKLFRDTNCGHNSVFYYCHTSSFVTINIYPTLIFN